MRRQIGWLVAATTSAIILAFVIPLCLLVRTLAEDRALSNGQQEAQSVAAVVSSLPAERIDQAVDLLADPAQRTTSVLLPGGQVAGAPDAAMRTDGDVARSTTSGAAFTVRDEDGLHILVPVAVADGVAVVRTSVTNAQLHSGVGAAWVGITGAGGALLALAIGVAVTLSSRISAPVTDLATVADRLRQGEFAVRAQVAGPREVADLGKAFNQLADRIGGLLVAEREVAADLSHRLRTPITALQLDADAIREPELSDRMSGHIDHLRRTVDAVVAEARRPAQQPLGGSCNANPIVAERVAFWGPLAEDQQRRLDFATVPGALPVAMGDNDLRDLLDNLLDNVFAHTPEGVAFSVSLARRDGGGAVLEVRDEGPGLALPDPTQRGASGSGSSGLGLDIVRRIARQAGGDVQLGPPGRGGHVRVTLGAPPT